jgi:hypothetical protein
MRNRPLLLCVAALVALGTVGIAGTAEATLPSGTTPVAAGNPATTGIDAALAKAASISGTITSVAGTSSNNKVQAAVQVFAGSTFAGSGFSDGNGHYFVGGLKASATGYAVCVSGLFASGGASATGYLGRCYKTAAWNGSLPLPSGRVLVPLTPGQDVTGINIHLPSAAAIAGKVTSPSGTALNGVSIVARNRNSGARFFGFTSSTGAYKVRGLTAASKGYTVCADARGVASGTGYLPRCFKNVAWNGGSTLPSTATAVSVSLGHTHTGINITAPRAGAIAGTVTDAHNGNPVPGATVVAFGATDHLLSASATNGQGRYTIRGLAAASADQVCVYPTNTTPAVRYHGKCWKNVAWNGGSSLPSTTNPVSVHLASVHTGISFKLSKTVSSLASIAGIITASNGGAPLQGASVSVFTSGGTFVDSDSTDAAGQYKVAHLKASTTGYVVCASAAGVFTPTPPATGWAPRCYDGATSVAWNTVNVPAGATRVTLSAGQNRSGISIALPDGSAIAGTLTQAGSGGAIAATGVQVLVYNGSGKQVDSAFSSFVDGSYTVTGLNAGSYTVCFDGRFAFNASGWRPECYNDVAWSGTA